MPVSWIASSSDEIAKTRAVLRAMKPEGVLDELGFLSLLGLLSDRLYPSISTIMTRARYLIFVPAIYREVERRMRAGDRSAERMARDLQVKLCRALMETDAAAAGIIGKLTNGEVVRLPSSVYWSTFTTLGIATRPIYESAYLEELKDLRREQRVMRDDDRVYHDLDHEPFWDAGLSTRGLLNERGEFQSGISLDLTRREARYLRTRYLERENGQDETLLGLLLKRGDSDGDAYEPARLPWETPQLPPELKRVTEHARRLSLLARGARLQYDSMLFEKRGVPDSGTIDAFGEWFLIASPKLRNWDLDDLWALPCLRSSVHFDTRTFLGAWTRSITGHDNANSAFGDREARELIRKREHATRGPKGPLRSSFHLNAWRPPKAYDEREVYGLLYRQRIGTTIVRDILVGLKGSTQ